MKLATYVLTMTSNVIMMGIHKADIAIYTRAMNHSAILKLRHCQGRIGSGGQLFLTLGESYTRICKLQYALLTIRFKVHIQRG